MKLEKNCALLVIDIQQEDFMEMNERCMYSLYRSRCSSE